MSFQKLVDFAKAAGGLLLPHWGKLFIVAFLFLSSFEVSFKWSGPRIQAIEAPNTEQ